MRQPSILFQFARATIAALVIAAAVAAQSPVAGASRVDAGTGEVVSDWTAPALDATSWRSMSDRPAVRVPQDEESYSVTGMFNELHGEFMQKGFAFRQNLRAYYGMQDQAGVSSTDAELEFEEGYADAFIPLTLDPDMLLILGGVAGARRYSFTANAPVPGNERLYETAVHVGLGRFVTEDLYVEAMFRPGVYSDYGGTLTSDDWKFYGDVIATYQLQEDFYGKVGVVYDGTFKDAPVYPVIGFGVLFSESFRFDLLLPKNIELSWIPDPAWILKVGMSVKGNEYNARTAPDVNGDKFPYEVTVQELRLYVDGTIRFNDNLSAFGRVGSTLLGDIEWGNPGGVPGIDGSLDPALFFEIGAGLNF